MSVQNVPVPVVLQRVPCEHCDEAVGPVCHVCQKPVPLERSDTLLLGEAFLAELKKVKLETARALLVVLLDQLGANHCEAAWKRFRNMKREEAERIAERRRRDERFEAMMAELEPDKPRWNAWRALSEEERRQAWQSYLDRHQDEIAATRNRPAPVELPTGAVHWLAMSLDGRVLGDGPTFEEAHRQGVEEAVLYFMGNLDTCLSSGDPPPGWRDETGRDPDRFMEGSWIDGYLRVSGPAELVQALIESAVG
jgi:hypothetical protein